MAYQTIIYENNGNVATITFNRPEKLNTWPFVGGMVAEFHRALDEAEEDDDVKVVVLKGAGRAFSAGHDLGEVGFVYGAGTGKPGERRPSQRIRLKIDTAAIARNHQRVLLFPKVTIAQIHGHCVGEGMDLLEVCDLAIAAEDARFSHAEQRLGLAGASHIAGLLMFQVGMKRALHMLLTGDPITGKEAAEIGLVNKSVPADKLQEEVDKLAESICRLPRDGIAIGKAHRALLYEQLGLLGSFQLGAMSHVLVTNMRWEPDEYNFFKQRRDDGLRQAIHKRDERYGE